MELGTSVNLGSRERFLLGALGCVGTIAGSLGALWSDLPTPLRVFGGSTAALGVFLIGLATIWGVVASPIARSADTARATSRDNRTRPAPPRVRVRGAIGPGAPEPARKAARRR